MNLEESLQRIRQALHSREMRTRHGLGQHFLLNARLLRRIVQLADVRDRQVLEIGPGPGSLTAALLEAGARVTAVEIDPAWARFLHVQFASCEDLVLHTFDAMKNGGKDLEKLLASLHAPGSSPPLLVSNLPYQIASPLLVDLVRWSSAPQRLLVMVQREVAERLTARPGSRQRGLLTLLVGLRASVRRVLKLSPGQFTPPPKVESAVVEIVPDAEARETAARLSWLEPLVRSAFSGRRKMLRNSLAELLGVSLLPELGSTLSSLRAEALSNSQWLELARRLEERAGPSSSAVDPS